MYVKALTQTCPNVPVMCVSEGMPVSLSVSIASLQCALSLSPPSPFSKDISFQQVCTASSSESAAHSPDLTVDGNTATFWSSEPFVVTPTSAAALIPVDLTVRLKEASTPKSIGERCQV